MRNIFLGSIAACGPVWGCGAAIIDTAAYNGHTYHLLSQNDWTASEAEAVSLGGHLVTINDAAEDAFVSTRFLPTVGALGALWIGLTDQASEGTWVWISGDPSLYRNFAGGEPNNEHGIEDWAHIFPTADTRSPMWNDAPDLAFNFGAFGMYGVVEIVPAPGVSWLMGATIVFGSRRRRRG